MKICPNCHTEFVDDTAICQICHVPLEEIKRDLKSATQHIKHHVLLVSLETSKEADILEGMLNDQKICFYTERQRVSTQDSRGKYIDSMSIPGSGFSFYIEQMYLEKSLEIVKQLREYIVACTKEMKEEETGWDNEMGMVSPEETLAGKDLENLAKKAWWIIMGVAAAALIVFVIGIM